MTNPAVRMAAIVLATLLAACERTPATGYQGYVEGEFVNVASPLGGRLDTLAVARGDQARAGAALFALESDNEIAQRQQAEAQLKVAEAQLADQKLGRRPQELDVTRAQVAQAEAEARRTTLQVARDEAQYQIGGISRQQLDNSRAASAANDDRVRQLGSELAVARLPNRRDQLAAQASSVAAARAALDQAAWRLGQKTVKATRAGLVYDTLYQPGEYVNAGMPVVRMLPPENIKVRYFVPETALGRTMPGQAVRVQCDGCGADIPAHITYVAAQSEYTPPIIYSNESRTKLVYLVEAQPEPAAATRLKPGQPVSVLPN